MGNITSFFYWGTIFKTIVYFTFFIINNIDYQRFMKIHKNYSLKSHNTFGIDATAAAFVSIESTEDLKAVLSKNKLPIYVLGGGSNILFTKDYYDLLFIKNAISGIKIVEKGKNTEGSLFIVYASIRTNRQSAIFNLIFTPK